nr:hypothetical protein [Pedobacter sp. ASV19]
MKQDSQNVTDYTNNNTIFMVWNFKDNSEVKSVFNQLCKLVINLNNSCLLYTSDAADERED